MASDLSQLPDPLAVVPADGPLDADVRVPGSKSVTNRALVCAALATGTSTLTGALFADDTEAMVGVLRALGIGTVGDPEGERLTVTGAGGDGIQGSPTPVDVRQSGTTARFALPLLALAERPTVVTAHPQMQARPMGTTFDALRALGASIDEQGAPGHLPAAVGGGLRGGTVAVPGDASSQFLSGLLLVGPALDRGLRVELTTDLVSRPYVDLTVAVMAAFGAEVHRPDDRTFVVAPGGYRARTYDVEPDASAASYPLAAAAICGGRVKVLGLTNRALQGDVAFAGLLGTMGAEVTSDATGTEVRAERGRLRGGRFDLTHLSDTAQTLAVVAPFAAEPVAISGIGFIRRKEVDRIEAVATELHRCGIDVTVDADGWTVRPGAPHPAVVQTYEDHRMAMSFALLGLVTPGIEIAGPGCVAKTFPGYWALLDRLRTGSGPTTQP